MKRFAGFVLCFSLAQQTQPLMAQVIAAEATKPHAFEISCRWAHEARLDVNSPAPETVQGIHAASQAPQRHAETDSAVMVEIAGLTGARHFVMRDLGSVLAGEMLTIYPDGTSVRMSNYRLNGEIQAHALLGTCEVTG